MSGAKSVIGIIGGRGVLGTVFTREFRALGFTVLRSSSRPDGVEFLANEEVVRQADIVIVSVPLQDSTRVIRELAPALRADQLFCDFTSVKVDPVHEMLASRAEVVGLHPMFGEVSSVSGQNCVVCPARPGARWPELRDALVHMGLRLHEQTPEEHDRFATVHQTVPHLLALVYADYLAETDADPRRVFEICSPSTHFFLLSAARQISQDAQLYWHIQALNPTARSAVRHLAEIFTRLADDAEQGSGDAFLGAWDRAREHLGDFAPFAQRLTTEIFSSEIARMKE